jgi:hypothetical protein
VIKRVTDALVSASLPAMMTAVEKEVGLRRATAPSA